MVVEGGTPSLPRRDDVRLCSDASFVVIASEAKQSIRTFGLLRCLGWVRMDCFVASLLAMTGLGELAGFGGMVGVRIPLLWRGARRAGWFGGLRSKCRHFVFSTNHPVRLRRPPLQGRVILCPDAPPVVIARAEGPQQSIRRVGLLRRFGWGSYGLLRRFTPRNDDQGELAGFGGWLGSEFPSSGGEFIVQLPWAGEGRDLTRFWQESRIAAFAELIRTTCRAKDAATGAQMRRKRYRKMP
jgi:hypothetical protein